MVVKKIATGHSRVGIYMHACMPRKYSNNMRSVASWCPGLPTSRVTEDGGGEAECNLKCYTDYYEKCH